MVRARRAPELVFQPIVDLQRRVTVGYEALSRFPAPPVATPDRWFAAAKQVGCAVELEALVIERALAQRAELPPNSFLSINVAPEALLEAEVQSLLNKGPLERVVFELTEHTAVADYELLARAIEEVRAHGAFVAVDDAGAGYASLQHILLLRPDFVKLDRALIAGLDRDEAKAALVEMFGGFSSRIDAWLLAEGIEEPAELARLIQLGVPLGQGYLLGRPDRRMLGVDSQVFGRAVSLLRCEVELTIAGVAEPWSAREHALSEAELYAIFALDPSITVLPLLDAQARVVSLGIRRGSEVLRRSVTSVLESSAVEEVLRRALTRPSESRFDPLVCCDELGVYRGVVPIERLVEAVMGRTKQ
jgi:EAL domain-containing protein (putative c-di-GMP-specific phosphodiesterase class I)